MGLPFSQSSPDCPFLSWHLLVNEGDAGREVGSEDGGKESRDILATLVDIEEGLTFILH